MLRELQEASNAVGNQIKQKLLLAAAAGDIPDLNQLVEEYWRLRLRRTIRDWKTDNLPPIVTHDLEDDAGDSVLVKLRECGLFNAQDDRVKVVYHPDFVTTADPLFGLEYEQFVRGCHMGIFPSYYEPWGYTPLESIALGVPAITSDLAGFGSYLQKILGGHLAQNGVGIVHRRRSEFGASAEQLTELLYRFCHLGRRDRIALRNRTEQYSVQFDWHNLGQYAEAHELALNRIALPLAAQ
jgi:glycogen(starch) synthase